MNPDLKKNRLINALSGSLPGSKAQQKMAPEFRGTFQHHARQRIAGVMILIFPYPVSRHLLFIKRNAYPGPHSAQISFPGGLHEADDRDLAYTAVREAREETGIDVDIEILGKLTPLYIPVSNFLVTPYIGWVKDVPKFNPDCSEVEYLIFVPVAELFDPDIIKWEKIKRHGFEFMSPYYALSNEKIWGATAMILSEFLELAGQMR